MKPEASPALLPKQLLWLQLLAWCVWLPLLAQLPGWLAAISALMLAWRAWLYWHGLQQHLAEPAASAAAANLPARWLMVLLACASAAGIVLHYHTLFGREPGIALLSLLLSLKLLETRNRRDAMAFVLLGCFVLMGPFFHSQSMLTAAAMLAGCLLTCINLLQLQHPQHDTRSLLGLAGRLLLQAAPIMLLLFFLFPRLQTPLWGLPADAYAATSGLSDSMAPGSISQLTQSDAIAFRVHFDSPEQARHLPREALYWRGPVLSHFDGRSWQMAEQTPARLNAPPHATDGQAIDYAITLEAHHKTWLFALELPLSLPPDAYMTEDYRLLAHAPVHGRMRYRLSSLPSEQLRPGLAEMENATRLRAALQLPPDINPQSRALARRWLGQVQGQPERMVQQMLQHLRAEEFHYTLRPPLLGRDSIDDFMFHSRRGFCEHYAAAFVFIMRAAGIPSRVVTGYQGGEVNPLDGTLIVRQSDAHAWAEVWLAGRGWRRVDPTAAIAPTRIEHDLASALPPSELNQLPLFAQPAWQWLRQWRNRWEAAGNVWNQWVIGYNLERQQRLFGGLGWHAPDSAQLSLLFAGVVALLLGGLTLWFLHQPHSHDTLERAWQRLGRALARRSLARAPWQGPLDYARHLQHAAREAGLSPELTTEIVQIAAHYARLRYAATRPSQASECRALQQRIQRLIKHLP